MGHLLKNLIGRRVRQDAWTDHAYRVTDKVSILNFRTRCSGLSWAPKKAIVSRLSGCVRRPQASPCSRCPDGQRSPPVLPLSAVGVRWWSCVARCFVKCDQSSVGRARNRLSEPVTKAYRLILRAVLVVHARISVAHKGNVDFTSHTRRTQCVYEGMAERMKDLGAVGDPMCVASFLRCHSCSRWSE
jgi:hypothetical protein